MENWKINSFLSDMFYIIYKVSSILKMAFAYLQLYLSAKILHSMLRYEIWIHVSALA